MDSAFIKDILRTIRKEKRRFFSILIITALGVMMFSGLKASCEDLRNSADRFFDAQNLRDLQIVSTLGLDENDLKVLSEMEEIETVSGIYSEETDSVCNDIPLRITLTTLSEEGIDMPYVLEGTLPKEKNECAVPERFVKDTGAKTGDRILIEEKSGEEETENFPVKEYVISAIVTDVSDLNNPNGSVAFRESTIRSDTVFIRFDAVETDVYTAALIRIKGAEELHCFSDEYTDTVSALKKKIETNVQKDRETARTERIRREAYEKVRKAEEEVLKELEDARKKLEDAQKEYEDGKRELDENSRLLEEGRRTAEKALADAQRLINENRALLERQKAEFEKTKADLLKQIEELKEQKQGLLDAKDGLKQIDDGIQQIDEGLAQLESDEIKAIMNLLSSLPEDTEITQLIDGVSEIMGIVDELKETGLIPEDFSFKDAMGELDALIEKADEERTVLESEETLSLIARLREADPEMRLEETGEEYEAVLTILGQYSPLAEIETAGQFVQTYDLAVSILNFAAEAASSDEYQQIHTIADLTDEDDTMFSDPQELKKMFDEMAEMLAEIAGTEKPQTVSELVQTWQTALEKLQKQKEELVTLRAEIVSSLNENGIEEDEIDSTVAQIDDGIRQILDGIAYGEQQIADGERQLNEGQAELDLNRIETMAQLADALRQIQEGYQKLLDGKKELDEGWEDFHEGEQEAKEEFDKAYQTIDDIDTASWYLLDRMSLSGYANIDSDAGSIEAIGTVFPIVFLVVAVLISLTSITRMVEEERGLIGTYKSLGYTDSEIRMKYIAYAFSASICGSVLGTVMAFVALPAFIFVIFGIMYLIPKYHFSFLSSYGISGPMVFIVAVLAAVYFASASELKQVPAALMRPKAPRAGSKVFLEKITPLWKRMSFLNKVTSRNLFRYKKRMFMTIFGIAGCMALLLFGFAIGDSVHDLMPRQYEQTFLYDVLCAASSDEHEELSEAVRNHKDTGIYADIMIISADVSVHNGRPETVQAIIFDDETDVSQYVSLRDIKGNPLQLGMHDIMITQNAGNVLGFKDGDTISVQLNDLQKAELPVRNLVQNYLGNYLFMRRSAYEDYYHDFMENGLLIRLNDKDCDAAAYTQLLKSKPNVMSVISTAELRDQFSTAFVLINAVVYIVIIMSAALAFVVLFTLSSINVSERTREIATIKVLGFFDGEVHTYIDKETVILTVIGIAAGLPLGWAFAQTLTAILNLPSIYLAVSLHGVSYFYAAGLTLLFMVIVNLSSDRVLDRVDPVEALKSVE